MAETSRNWHNQSIDSVITELDSSKDGLRKSDAVHRLYKNGANHIQTEKSISKLNILLSQFKSFIVWILIAAAILFAIFNELTNAILILIILFINTIVGFYQQYKAEKTIQAINRLSALKSTVIRHGVEMRVKASELVKGDIIILNAGNFVPADARLIETTGLRVNESLLSGESSLINKNEAVLKKETHFSDRKNMIYAGTTIASGNAKAIIIETGMKTELGKRTHVIEKEHSKKTVLEKKLTILGEIIGIGVIIICAVVFILGLFKGTGNYSEILMISISLAVAAIPEGLPAIVTICLAIGVHKMIKRNIIIRKLSSVETLGEIDIICTDKAGILTCNKMTVREIYANNMNIFVSGQGYRPIGDFTDKDNIKKDTDKIKLLLKCSVICNEASLHRGHDEWEIKGDQTEGALVAAAKKAGIDKEELDKKGYKLDTIQFEPARKMMSVLYREKNRVMLYTKGAPETIIAKCSKIYINGIVKKLDYKQMEKILIENHRLSSKGLRVLGFACKEAKKLRYDYRKNIEEDLIFLGLIGMNDPLREDSKVSVTRCSDAGIKVVMITGDNRATAVAIAQELGMGTFSVTGEEIDKMDSLKNIVDYVDIYARVTPEHKLRIIEAMQANGHVVAMTGKGINDSSALKKADIGIAMDAAGTDVSKESSDIVLGNDNFTSIVNAVEEGRIIHDNIKKFVRYLLTSNMGEVLTLLIAMIIGYHSVKTGNLILPLFAVQLLMINLLTDGFPALGLSIDKGENDIMKRKPRKKGENIVNINFIIDVLLVGVVMCIGTLFMFQYGLKHSDYYAQTLAFTTLVVFQLFNVFNCRSEKNSIFSRHTLTNKWLWLGVLSSLGIQLIVIYTPISEFFRTVPLGIWDWVLIAVVCSTVIVAMEAKKFIYRLESHYIESLYNKEKDKTYS